MAVKYHKWNSFMVLGLDEIIGILEGKGIDMRKDRTAIIGSLYNPETQEISIFLTSMLTSNQDKKFSKEFEKLWGEAQRKNE